MKTAVTLLTAVGCHLCDDAKKVLERLEAELSITIEIIDLDSPRGIKLAATAGMAFPPAVFLDGEPFSYGRLSERKLRKALTKHNTDRTLTHGCGTLTGVPDRAASAL